MKQLRAIVLGAGYRGRAYAEYATHYPDRLKIVGVADPLQNSVIDTRCRWSDWRAAVDEHPEADVAIVALPDSLHEEAALAALEAGYHLLLEKPIATSEAGCKKIIETALRLGKLVLPGHVLRYTPYFSEIKRLIDSGALGDVVSIAHQESAGYHKMAHSFVRGNWARASRSSPIILQKCSHDMDLFVWWLSGRACRRVTSFGSIGLFRADRAPRSSADRCLECAVESECVWSAKKMYLQSDELKYLFADTSDEAMEEIVRESPYGRCVFKCDNDVPDHQVVQLEFEGGVTVSHVLSGLTAENVRTTRISLTRGEITGDGERLTIRRFDGEDVPSSLEVDNRNPSRHDGGDFNLVSEFLAILDRNDEEEIRRTTQAALAGHLICFAAEQSRLAGGKVIDL